MAHKVMFTVPYRELGKADIAFIVKRNGEGIGKLLISKGAVEWLPKNKQYGSKLGWRKFAEIMQDARRTK